MKTFFSTLIILLLSLVSYAQNDSTTTTQEPSQPLQQPSQEAASTQTNTTEGLWEQANAAYLEGQYPKAVADYEAILERGQYSAKLYFNLGNAYFQQNRIGKAILNYVRARNLDPADEDIEYNLHIAQARTKDKIEPVPQFILKKWLVSVSSLLSSDLWAWCSIIMFAMALGGVLLWLLSNRMALRKLGFFFAIIAAVLFVASISYAQMAATKQYDQTGAVVINTAAPIKSSPAEAGKDLFVLHEGTIVNVLQELDQWREVSLADGNKGWIKASAIEMIN